MTLFVIRPWGGCHLAWHVCFLQPFVTLACLLLLFDCAVRGAGFDSTERRYSCLWDSPYFRVQSDLALPVDSEHFVCYTPDLVKYKDVSSTFMLMDGELAQTAYTNFTVLVDESVIQRDPPELYNNGSFMFR